MWHHLRGEHGHCSVPHFNPTICKPKAIWTCFIRRKKRKRKRIPKLLRLSAGDQFPSFLWSRPCKYLSSVCAFACVAIRDRFEILESELECCLRLPAWLDCAQQKQSALRGQQRKKVSRQGWTARGASSNIQCNYFVDIHSLPAQEIGL